MTDKKNSNPTPAPAKLSDEEAANVKGGLGTRPGGVGGVGSGGIIGAQPDSCKETTDTGMMGCPG